MQKAAPQTEAAPKTSSFKCFVCGRKTRLRSKKWTLGLCCVSCYKLIESMPIAAQRLLAFAWKRLWVLEARRGGGSNMAGRKNENERFRKHGR